MCFAILIISFVCRLYINGSLGSSMTYVNGSNVDDESNVVMTESASFGPDLLMFEALRSIKMNDELILNYGDSFLVPLEGRDQLVKQKGCARTKRAGRERPPPIPLSLPALTKKPKAANKRKRM